MLQVAQAQAPMKAPNYVPKLVHPSYNQAEIREARVKAGLPRYKIAIIDSGYDPTRATAPLVTCKTGHYDYFTKTANLAFQGEHGTRVASIVANKLKEVDYCVVVYQVSTIPNAPLPMNSNDLADAINLAIAEQVDAINISAGGVGTQSSIERAALVTAANLGISVFVAAGNNSQNLDKDCNYYPACYKIKGVIVVGAQDYDDPKQPANYSNYGKIVDLWGPGYYQEYRGTSYATPRALSEYILFLEHKRLKPSK
jgi:subtilisin family serine protease